MIIYDATLFDERPDLSVYGLPRLHNTDREWGSRVGIQPWNATVIDDANTRALARKVQVANKMVSLDMEQGTGFFHWDKRDQGEAVVRVSCDFLTKVANIIHDEAPDVQIGWYGDGFSDEYWTQITGSNLAKQSWRFAHLFLRQCLSPYIDWLAPGLYTFYEDIRGWEKASTVSLWETRGWGKPTIPFLWMEFHNSNPQLAGQLVPDDMWRYQLDYIKDTTGKMVLWGGWGRKWNPNASWFKLLQRYL